VRSYLRSLRPQGPEAEMATALDKFMVVGRGIEPGTLMHLILTYAAQAPWITCQTTLAATPPDMRVFIRRFGGLS
jgi:hypothetical protein